MHASTLGDQFDVTKLAEDFENHTRRLYCPARNETGAGHGRQADLTIHDPLSTIMTPAAKTPRLARGFETIRCSLASTPTGGKIRMAHEVPALPYDYSALEPYIDTQTMHLHHDKHHVAYVTNLNAALEKAPELQKMSVEELVKGLANVPEAIRNAVRNNAGGHVNHTMFWTIMGPNAGGEPSGAIAEAIKNTIGAEE